MKQFLLGAGIFTAVVVVVICFCFPKLITGDYSEVTIKSLKVSQKGQVDMEITTVHSAATRQEEKFFAGDRYQGGGSSSGGTFPGRPSKGGSGMTFSLNPEHQPVEGRFEDSPLYKRLLVRQGDKKLARPGEPLYFYKFTGSDGVLYQGYLQVSPR